MVYTEVKSSAQVATPSGAWRNRVSVGSWAAWCQYSVTERDSNFYNFSLRMAARTMMYLDLSPTTYTLSACHEVGQERLLFVGPSNMRVYFRKGFAQTILRAVTLR